MELSERKSILIAKLPFFSGSLPTSELLPRGHTSGSPATEIIAIMLHRFENSWNSFAY